MILKSPCYGYGFFKTINFNYIEFLKPVTLYNKTNFHLRTVRVFELVIFIIHNFFLETKSIVIYELCPLYLWDWYVIVYIQHGKQSKN